MVPPSDPVLKLFVVSDRHFRVLPASFPLSPLAASDPSYLTFGFEYRCVSSWLYRNRLICSLAPSYWCSPESINVMNTTMPLYCLTSVSDMPLLRGLSTCKPLRWAASALEPPTYVPVISGHSNLCSCATVSLCSCRDHHAGSIHTAFSSAALSQAFPQAQPPLSVGSQLYCQFPEKAAPRWRVIVLLFLWQSEHCSLSKARVTDT